MFTIKRLNHIVLYVRDAQRSLAFYRDVLGFQVKFAKPEIALLARGGMQLYLTAESPETPDKPGIVLAPPRDPARPPVDLIFEVRDARREYAELSARGLQFFTEPQAPPWGGLRCFARDPDGYLIEIEQPK